MAAYPNLLADNRDPWLSSISASRIFLMICSGVYPFLAISTPFLRDYDWYRFREARHLNNEPYSCPQIESAVGIKYLM